MDREQFMSRHTVFSVQAICILGMVANVLGKSDLLIPWISAGIRIAQCPGFHHIEKSVFSESWNETVEMEVERRVWWKLVELDYHSIPYTGTYLIKSTQRISQRGKPRNCNDDLAHEDEGQLTTSTYSIIKAKMALLIPALLDGPQQDVASRYQHVVDIDRKMRELVANIPRAILRDQNGTESTLEWLTLARRTLAIAAADKIIMIHRSFLLKSFQSPAYLFTRQTCVSAAMTILREHEEISIAGPECPAIWVHSAFCVAAIVVICLELLFCHASIAPQRKAHYLALIRAARIRLNKSKNDTMARRGVFLVDAMLNEGLYHDHCADNTSEDSTRQKFIQILHKFIQFDAASSESPSGGGESFTGEQYDDFNVWFNNHFRLHQSTWLFLSTCPTTISPGGNTQNHLQLTHQISPSKLIQHAASCCASPDQTTASRATQINAPRRRSNPPRLHDPIQPNPTIRIRQANISTSLLRQRRPTHPEPTRHLPQNPLRHRRPPRPSPPPPPLRRPKASHLPQRHPLAEQQLPDPARPISHSHRIRPRQQPRGHPLPPSQTRRPIDVPRAPVDGRRNRSGTHQAVPLAHGCRAVRAPPRRCTPITVPSLPPQTLPFPSHETELCKSLQTQRSSSPWRGTSTSCPVPRGTNREVALNNYSALRAARLRDNPQLQNHIRRPKYFIRRPRSPSQRVTPVRAEQSPFFLSLWCGGTLGMGVRSRGVMFIMLLRLSIPRRGVGSVINELAEVRRICYELQKKVCRSENVYAHEWREGDLVVFHN
ncbi:unnamed protein product [Periconia digitata]|uniref:Transcription factor domain-containing protein n=1 Tax=Periconia digitata TaxID=1303443 RepID=A0A9W4UJH8_9PLEO|nr:unnamed protein product [Periconia digitata]